MFTKTFSFMQAKEVVVLFLKCIHQKILCFFLISLSLSVVIKIKVALV